MRGARQCVTRARRATAHGTSRPRAGSKRADFEFRNAVALARADLEPEPVE